jgi:hypothetical protein
MRWPLVAPLFFSLVGCGGALADGEADFRHGRYPEAKQSLASLEIESASWNDSARAEYALYRGLTLAALGNRPQARVWLREAQAVEDAHEGSLRDMDARRLRVAIEANEVP